MLFKSVDFAYYLKKGQVVKHPIFGRCRIDFIMQDLESRHCEFYVSLLDFNEATFLLDGEALARLVFKEKPLLKVVK
jgi:hypothetical protein